MRLLFSLLLIVVAASGAVAQPTGQRFVSVSFHDVADHREDLTTDAVLTKTLVQFFDWLKGDGWTVVSLDDLSAAARGTRSLPPKAILLTFDDGYRSLYTRVFPLLQIYRYPTISALVGSWMEGSADGTVLYGDKRVRRDTFISWAEAREMQASGLVEFASHSYALHGSVMANPQGNLLPAAITLRYDPATGRYENDAEYRGRIGADLTRDRHLMQAELGRAPRALVWPYGRYRGPALDVAKQLGFSFALTLEPEPAYTSDLYAIHRYFPTRNARLADIVSNLRFEPGRPTTRRIACVTLDAMAAAGRGGAQDEALGHLIEGLRTLGANVVVIDGNAALPTADAPLGDVFFPTDRLRTRADLLSRAVWQIRTRGGADVFVRLPLEAAVRALGPTGTSALFADMIRHSAPEGIALDVGSTATIARIVEDQPRDIRARRAMLDAAGLDEHTGLALAAYRAAAAIDPRLRLMLFMQDAHGPPDWVDIGVLPPAETPAATVMLATRLRSEGWLRPDVSGRVAFSLPGEPGSQIEALHGAQRQGAVAFALCPGSPPLSPAPALAASFSSATYPYRP
jgi:peptidoglycan/xylan/chitin deacetylase (PgdA/CDA1 family)